MQGKPVKFQAKNGKTSNKNLCEKYFSISRRIVLQCHRKAEKSKCNLKSRQWQPKWSLWRLHSSKYFITKSYWWMKKVQKGKSWLTNTRKGEKLGEITPQHSSRAITACSSVFPKTLRIQSHGVGIFWAIVLRSFFRQEASLVSPSS